MTRRIFIAAAAMVLGVGLSMLHSPFAGIQQPGTQPLEVANLETPTSATTATAATAPRSSPRTTGAAA